MDTHLIPNLFSLGKWRWRRWRWVHFFIYNTFIVSQNKMSCLAACGSTLDVIHLDNANGLALKSDLCGSFPSCAIRLWQRWSGGEWITHWGKSLWQHCLRALLGNQSVRRIKMLCWIRAGLDWAVWLLNGDQRRFLNDWQHPIERCCDLLLNIVWIVSNCFFPTVSRVFLHESLVELWVLPMHSPMLLVHLWSSSNFSRHMMHQWDVCFLCK